jgi:hypothetical protein
MGMALFLCFFFMGLVTGVSSTTVVCEGYVPSVLVLFVMEFSYSPAVKFPLLFRQQRTNVLAWILRFSVVVFGGYGAVMVQWGVGASVGVFGSDGSAVFYVFWLW